MRSGTLVARTHEAIRTDDGARGMQAGMRVRVGLLVAAGIIAVTGVTVAVGPSSTPGGMFGGSSVVAAAAEDDAPNLEATGGAAEDAADERDAAAAEVAARVAEQQRVRDTFAQVAAESAEAAEAERARIAAEEAARIEEERIAAEERRQALLAAQQRLTDLGYLIGAVDGAQGQQTTAAVMAFQAVNGLQVDGVLGPQTQAALDGTPVEPTLRGGPATRIEVDLDRQVLHLVEGDRRVVTFKTSTGGGQEYTRGDGSVGVARTPVGEFTITRRIAGERVSSAGLGILYDPLYFLGGFAIHGSNNVPAGPASAGCARLARADAVWLFDRVPNGTPVHLHGGQHTFVPRGA